MSLIQGLIVMMVVVEMNFVICYCGQQLTDRCAQVSDAIYRLRWYEYPKETKKSIVLVLACAQKPVYLTNLQIAVCSLESFAAVRLRFDSFIRTKIFIEFTCRWWKWHSRISFRCGLLKDIDAYILSRRNRLEFFHRVNSSNKQQPLLVPAKIQDSNTYETRTETSFNHTQIDGVKLVYVSGIIPGHLLLNQKSKILCFGSSRSYRNGKWRMQVLKMKYLIVEPFSLEWMEDSWAWHILSPFMAKSMASAVFASEKCCLQNYKVSFDGKKMNFEMLGCWFV